jgi:superfamily II DNA/RNA helicase/HEPN domain-containing protein
MQKRQRHPAADRVLKAKPSLRGWKTTDKEEIERRRLRASIEPISIEPLEPGRSFYGTFIARSRESARTYFVEIRSLTDLENSCQCIDYQTNGLATCKHIEAVLFDLRKGRIRLFKQAAQERSPYVEIYLLRRGTPEIRVAWPEKTSEGTRSVVAPFFSSSNTLLADPIKAIPALKRTLAREPKKVQREIRLARDVEEWVAGLRRNEEHLQAREQFLQDVKDGKRTMDFLRHSLYPYQQEGVLHLAFNERALLADDMGLGKTVEAIGACELLRQTRNVERVLVVCPVSLKTEWEEQISKFTTLPARTIWGPRPARLKMYRESSFFYLCNYEQIRSDIRDINRILAPDIVILDEAQRIKNWQTKTAKSVKQLSSPYAFVLTGTPLENRIDEIYSIVEFLNPQLFGPLFRFNREFYELDDKGRPAGYKNLEKMHRRIRSVMLRRRKDEVEEQLPGRTVNNYFVSMETEQRDRYDEYRERVARLLAITKRRPLKKEEVQILQKWLACMRMLCDTPYILDRDCRICPKLPELASILEDVAASNGHKVLVFSEWERMLHLVRDLAKDMGLGFAWHTGSVPQQKRREQIRMFKDNPDCSLFLSTDSGSVGLNLQEASVVVNIDLPWNPAKLEQRIARAWRKYQTRSVGIINLISEQSIEHRMLGMLAQKQQLADGVLDGRGDLKAIKMPSGHAAFLERLESLMDMKAEAVVSRPSGPSLEITENPYEAFRDGMAARMAGRLLSLESCQNEGRSTILVVIDGPVDQSKHLADRLLRESFSESKDLPSLEMMDRSTYEAIQRLTNAGFLKMDKNSVHKLHSSPAFADRASIDRDRLQKEAQRIFSQAERKMQMSSVLAEGGFPLEALTPLSQAVELTLKASAYLAGEDDVEGEEDLSLSHIQSRIIPAGLLPDNAVAIVASLRESVQQPEKLDDDAARNMIQSCQKLINQVSQAVNKSALG